MNRTEFNIVLSAEPPRTSPNVIHSHIPVPRISTAIKAQERCPPKRRGSFEKLGRGTGNVAAQRASFEKLEASVVQLRSRNNNQLSTSSIEMRKSEEKTTPVSVCKANDIVKLNRSNSFLESKWKNKYEDSEKRRKQMLQKNEMANKEHADLEKKFQQLQKENSSLQSQVQEKEQKLLKLRTVSEAVCKEYEQLKHQYDVETNAMHKAMQQASQWYRQNRELKRRSQIMAQKFLNSNPDESLHLDMTDEVDANDDLDQLRQTVKELSGEIARLQTELHSARLQEFEAQEQVMQLTTQLEEERILRQKGEEKINEMKVHKENMERVTKMVAEEVQTLKTQCDRERESAKLLKMESERVQKERNVLAHQSALLMAEVVDDPNGRLLSVLQEVESLKRALEEEQQNHACQVQILQEKLEEKESNVEFEIVEEKLKLAESELEVVVHRAERAEKSVEELESVVNSLKRKIGELEEKVSKPLPPPLPPPPPPPPMLMNGQSSIKLLTKERLTSAVSDMENMLGITPKKAPAVAQQPAIDDIINQIKGGRFTLKHTDKQREEERKRRQEAESKPPAVSEMLSILGTMRRRAKPIRQSIKFTDTS
ncbi:hypothetical protein PUN28_014620 [Cardiocondyla obscurior]|uniref:Shootin-1 n=1 Tax=Cardiocondyla obscurior TaxID=286306 RepID=A0AAW2F5A9_9HYME